jgi:predicted carbohydrate-binding protein with CBM5 and CBM33 domain
MLYAKTYITYLLIILITYSSNLLGHGTCITPKSRAYRIFQSNIENPNFQLARNATNIDSKNAYYTWNEVSRNIPEAVTAGLPVGFDSSQWIPDGQIASGGRVDPNTFGTTYGGLDQISTDQDEKLGDYA